MPVDVINLHEFSYEELLQRAQELALKGADQLRRPDLIFAIAAKQGEQDGRELGRGVLEVHGEGFGFLRSASDSFLPGVGDIYVSQSQIRRFKLRTGDSVIGVVRPPKEGERYTALLRVESVNGDPPGVDAPIFERLTAIYPDERVSLGEDPVLRALDFVAPLGLGQRGVLVAPRGSGRETLLRRLVDAVSIDEELDVCVLLADERPEEIGEWRKLPRVEVIATPCDAPPASHLQVADMVFERARRLAERGDDVVVVVDSLTRLLRAALMTADPAGATYDGLNVSALSRIRGYLSAARALEDGGSLTVVGVVSGSEGLSIPLLADLSEVMNWELVLSSELALRGVCPPVDARNSCSPSQDRVLTEAELEVRRSWRESLSGDLLEDARSLLASSGFATRLDSVAESGN